MIRVFLILLTFFISDSSFSKELKTIGADIAGVFKSEALGKGNSLRRVTGREERIIQAVYRCMGYNLKVSLLPFGRHTKFYEKTNDYDAVSTVYENLRLKGFVSDSHITYSNGISYLTQKYGNSINEVKDLVGKRVISFIGAKDMFPELKKIIPKLKSYSENSDQAIHSKMLYFDRVDVVISDAVIFAHHTAQLQQDNLEKYHKQITFKQIFEPSIFKMYFKKEQHRDMFNQCLKEIVDSKKINRLNIEYYNELIINK